MAEQHVERPQAADQLTDVLLVFDQEKMKVQAVKGIDKNGELETVDPTKKNQSQFMRVDKHGDPFSNFFSNFMQQVKDPTRFNFLKVPMEKAARIAANLGRQFKDGTLSPEGRKIIEQHEVRSEGLVQTHSNGKKLEEPIVKPTKEGTSTEGAPVKVPEQAPPKQETQTTPVSPEPAGPSNDNQYRYKPEQIDWDTMSKFGLTREKLEKEGVLDDLLRGYKTGKLLPVTGNFGTIITKSDARLSLRTNEQGDVVTVVHGVRKAADLHLPFFGHKFSPEDKDNLLKSGNMGRVVELTNPKTQEKIPSIISLDRMTNEIVALRTSAIKIPQEMKGVTFDEGQKQALAEGKPLYVEGMLSTKNKPFNATLQFNAEKGYIEFLFNNNNQAKQTINAQQKQDAPRNFRGYALNDEQYNTFKEGRAVYLAELVDKKGEPYKGYIRFNKDTNRTEFSFYNPDRLTSRATPAEGHKTQVAVNSGGKTNEATKKVQEPLKPGQSQPDGNQRQKDQNQKDHQNKKSAGPKM